MKATPLTRTRRALPRRMWTCIVAGPPYSARLTLNQAARVHGVRIEDGDENELVLLDSPRHPGVDLPAGTTLSVALIQGYPMMTMCLPTTRP